MWKYSQSQHTLTDEEDQLFTDNAYSGHGQGLNNPVMQDVVMVGPIPQGMYEFGPPFTHPQTGPVSMRLTPTPGTNTFERAGFLIHGDNSKHDHTASEGCIIVCDHNQRELLSKSLDRLLLVVR